MFIFTYYTASDLSTVPLACFFLLINLALHPPRCLLLLGVWYAFHACLFVVAIPFIGFRNWISSSADPQYCHLLWWWQWSSRREQGSSEVLLLLFKQPYLGDASVFFRCCCFCWWLFWCSVLWLSSNNHRNSEAVAGLNPLLPTWTAVRRTLTHPYG